MSDTLNQLEDDVIKCPGKDQFFCITNLWLFSLTLSCNKDVLKYVGGWAVLKSPKTPLHNMKMVPNA